MQADQLVSIFVEKQTLFSRKAGIIFILVVKLNSLAEFWNDQNSI